MDITQGFMPIPHQHYKLWFYEVFVVSLDRIAVEGKVIQRADCQPDKTISYMNLKR